MSYIQPDKSLVRGLAISAAKWAIFLVVIRQALTIVSTMIVSRYVTPLDVGSFGVVSTLLAFAVLFDTGLAWATVQPKDISPDEVDTAFWFGCFIGFFLWVICIFLSTYVAGYFKNDDIKIILITMGAVPFLNSLTTQPAALLKRQLKQKQTNVIDTFSLAFSLVLSISFAVHGGGYWSLVAQALSVQFLRSILYFIYSGYKPSFFWVMEKKYRLLKIGGVLAVSNYVCYFQLYLCTILVALFCGETNLGFYLKANGLKILPTMYATMVVTDVMVASLSAYQSDLKKLGDAYRKALVLTSFIGCPAGAMLWPLSSELVNIFYGDQWTAAAPLLRELSLAAIILPINTTTVWLFLSSGKAKMQLLCNVALTGVTLIVYFLCICFLDFRLTWQIVMVDVLLCIFLYPVVNLWYSHRLCDLSLLDSMRGVSPVFLISVASAVLVEAVGFFIKNENGWFYIFLLKSYVGAVFYVCACMFFMKTFPLPRLQLFLNKKVVLFA